MQTTVLWTGREYYSLEHCNLTHADAGAVAHSVIVGLYQETMYRVEYLIKTNPAWETVFVHVKSQMGGREDLLRLERDGKGNWMVNGRPAGQFEGCTDVDIPLTPFTNTLPINRLKLTPGKRQSALFKLIEAEYRNPAHFTDEILRGYLHALIHKAYADHRLLQCRVGNPDHPGIRLLKAFTALYMRDFDAARKAQVARLQTVAGYAGALGVTPNHLNDTIKAVTGQSAGRLIRTQLIKQAAMCLKHSTKTISEIACQLGFEDPSYFSRFYKSQTGKSPSDYR